MTDIDRLIAAQEETQKRLDAQTEALNGLGENVQWVINQAKGIFEMLGSPEMMAMLPNMMGGMPDGDQH